MICPKIAVVMLAAGNSNRMGSPKQLLDFGGQPLIRHSVETALASEATHVIVVLGARSEEIAPALDGLNVTIVENPAWEGGMGTSIHTGIAAAERLDCSAAILTLADQPFVTAQKLNTLIMEHVLNGHGIVTAEYAETVGVPVLFSDEYFGHLLALKPDQGCKGVILKNGDVALRVPTPEAEMDVDTPEDYQRLVTILTLQTA